MMNGTIVETYDKYNRKTYTKKQLKIFEGSYYSPELDTTYELKVMDDLLYVIHPKMGNIAVASVKKMVLLEVIGNLDLLSSKKTIKNKLLGLGSHPIGLEMYISKENSIKSLKKVVFKIITMNYIYFKYRT
ncbi:hypothetical protein [Flavobacterium piscinae]|uniref:hypothetical protein n=1 Tax=Flavobacterium piscinae TaxID=2506424 RepID=UPI002AAB1F2F|nr:hypothetical protein [Flavobacterium piscinae]